MKNTMNKVGVWSFMVGVVLALIAGVLASNLSGYMGLISTAMVVLGLVVGALNISEKEVTGFIIAAVGLATGSIAIANLGVLLGGSLGGMLETSFRVFGVFIAGAVFVPALKAVYKISKD
ncbi:MAG: hypothetical protein AABW92_02440 [Nanoarchaeota archaeon]